MNFKVSSQRPKCVSDCGAGKTNYKLRFNLLKQAHRNSDCFQRLEFYSEFNRIAISGELAGTADHDHHIRKRSTEL